MQTSKRGRVKRAVLVAATVLIALFGYLGFLAFKQFDVGGATGAGIALVAATVGIAAFFSPCSFPLLLAMLTRQASASPDGRGRSALSFAVGTSIGAVAFVSLFGLVLSLGGAALVNQFSFASTQGRVLRVVVGGVLILMGFMQLGKVRNPFGSLARFAEPIDRARRDVGDERKFTSHILYGFGYLIAGFG